MESGHGLPVAEPRQVVLRKHAEDGRAKTNRPQNLRARSRQFLRVLFAHEVFVGEMHEQRNTGIDGRHHGLGTYRMDLHHHAGLLRLRPRSARRTSNSLSLGPGTGVRAISPVNLTPISAIFRISARAVSGVSCYSASVRRTG